MMLSVTIPKKRQIRCTGTNAHFVLVLTLMISKALPRAKQLDREINFFLSTLRAQCQLATSTGRF